MSSVKDLLKDNADLVQENAELRILNHKNEVEIKRMTKAHIEYGQLVEGQIMEFESEIRVLKAKLAKAVEQRNDLVDTENILWEELISDLDLELDAITKETI